MTGHHRDRESTDESSNPGIPVQSIRPQVAGLPERANTAPGVVGEIAYDALRAELGSLRWPGQRSAGRREPDRPIVARVAVVTRCAELDLPVPSASTLSVESEQIDADTITFVLVGNDLRATVVMPRHRLDGTKITVTLTRIVPQQSDPLGR
ncbi:hypothetical protein [Stackebrandtia soli]|uniref:hypothetical protein n=1 Tax=Stackebrandtia soli TaxID=1892856 RepID=UPI0039EB5613